MSSAQIKLNVARRFTFCTAHRLIGKGAGRCGNVHGRNYTLWVYAESKNDKLTDLGFIVDFGILRDAIGGWLDRWWDHAYVGNNDDPLWNPISLTGSKMYALPTGNNSTMENMAWYLLHTVFPQLFEGEPFFIRKVELYETENAKVVAEVVPV